MRGKKKLSFRSIQTWPGIGNSKKNSKKIQKIKKQQYGFFSSQNGTGEAENERKSKFPYWTIPIGPGKRNSRKIAKKLKMSLRFLLKPKLDGTGWECEKKSILVPIHFNWTRNREFQKNSIKIQKHHYGFFSSQNRTR